jgi:hypothetical protein
VLVLWAATVGYRWSSVTAAFGGVYRRHAERVDERTADALRDSRRHRRPVVALSSKSCTITGSPPTRRRAESSARSCVGSTTSALPVRLTRRRPERRPELAELGASSAT